MKRLLPLFVALSLAPLLPITAAPTPPAPTAAAPVASPPAVVPAPVGEATPKPASPFDPAAVALLDKSAAAYKALDGLSMHYAVSDQSGAKTESITGIFSFSRPTSARLTAKVGTQNLLLVANNDRMFAQGRPDVYESSYAQEGDILQETAQKIPSALSVPLSSLVVGENPLNSELGTVVNKIALLPEDGVLFSARLRRGAPPIIFRLYFGANDHLLRRVEVEITNGKQKSLNLTTVTDIQTNPTFAPSAFAFTPPKGAREVKRPPLYSPTIKVGTVPPPLLGKDLTGKPISLDDYKGKVVLLDFWATWCSPCVAELPNVMQNLHTYHPDGFEVLGISLDRTKADLQAFAKAQGMTSRQVFDGGQFVGANAKRYGVNAIPFTLLIGKDGKITAINPRGPKLEPAIVKALAG